MKSQGLGGYSEGHNHKFWFLPISCLYLGYTNLTAGPCPNEFIDIEM